MHSTYFIVDILVDTFFGGLMIHETVTSVLPIFNHTIKPLFVGNNRVKAR